MSVKRPSLSEINRLDRDLYQLIEENGIHDVLGSLCRYCNERGLSILFRKLNRVYEWSIK